MELKSTKSVVDDHIEWLLWAMGLRHWKIHVEYKRLASVEGETCLGRCEVNRRYSEATISLDNEEIRDEEQLLWVLRHELLHIFHAGFETYRQMAIGQIDSAAVSAMDVAFHDAMEANVGHIERLFDLGLGMDAKAIVKRAKAHAKNSR